MKTPREIILERHQSAEDRLRQINPQDLAAYALSTAPGTDRSCREGPSSLLHRLLAEMTSFLTIAVKSFWQQSLWPWRKAWMSLAATWLVLLALSMDSQPGLKAMAPPSGPPNPEILQARQNQLMLLGQLLDVEIPSQPKKPSPRSERPPRYVVG